MSRFTFSLFFLTLLLQNLSICQSYTSYFTGNSTDSVATPSGGVCLMGGATEDDQAMTWFLQRAAGGDILILRASGSDGYNDYLYSDLGIAVNSVETIVFHQATAAQDPYIHQRIQQAEAIWLAGGDQWDYVSYWRNTAIDSLINDAIATRNLVIGGTSAGMAILGGFYFSAQNGTVSSTTALTNPYDTDVTVDSLPFISSSYLSEVITDTHYDNPDRKGRHIVFLARILVDYGIAAKGVACDEYTAVCIDTAGIASVYGQYPDYDDNAYFIQSNCEQEDITPEDCSPGNPLDWTLNQSAINVYTVKGTSDGSHTFDLNDWTTGVGGSWEHWYVENGVLNEAKGVQPDCPILDSTLHVSELTQTLGVSVFPNPADTHLVIQLDAPSHPVASIHLYDTQGLLIQRFMNPIVESLVIDTQQVPSGIYYLEVKTKDGLTVTQKVICR